MTNSLKALSFHIAVHDETLTSKNTVHYNPCPATHGNHLTRLPPVPLGNEKWQGILKFHQYYHVRPHEGIGILLIINPIPLHEMTLTFPADVTFTPSFPDDLHLPNEVVPWHHRILFDSLPTDL